MRPGSHRRGALNVRFKSRLFGRWVGITGERVTHAEKWLSAAGGMVGISGVVLISQAELGPMGSASVIGSMGASAVLLFAVPHGPLSQPWSVFGGHLVSAIIGVACLKLIPAPTLAAAIAVAAAIAAMHYLRCIHPPGGATALSAVVGGDAVHQLGFQFVLTPVMLNAITILVVAFLFNAPFAWRRYPAAWAPDAAANRSRVEFVREDSSE
ncbi:MAG: HPP family protein [Gammaproteobacteria bacterium]|nr:HPP family protein [Gammaproteobacteria bacterium]